MELLRSLRDEGIQLWSEGEKLRYRAPKGKLAPGLIEALVSCKSEIIALLQKPVAAGPCFQAWSPSPAKPKDYPLSFAQQRMWFLSQLEPESSALNVTMGFQLWGPLDLAALRSSLEELIARHEAFRTTCAVKDGVPMQVIVPPDDKSGAPFTIIDLHSTEEAEREAELHRWARIEAQQPFDLGRLPLLRSVLFRLADNHHMLLLTTHHFVIDGWSVGVLFRDLSELYNGHIRGSAPELGKLTVRYRDYALWQRERLQGAVLEELLAYWTKQLDGVAELTLPGDRLPEVASARGGATVWFSLSSELSQAIKALSRREGVTLFMTLLATFKTLLHRYSRQNDIVVGTAVSDRCMVETQALVGCFANTLVLRTNFEGNPTFRELLRRVHETSVGAFDHQDLPFEMLVRQLLPERLDARNPLFQASFQLNQHSEGQTLQLDELRTRHLPIDLGLSRFDLLLEVFDERERLSAFLEYNTDLFLSDRIQRMVGHWQTLLQEVVSNPDRRVSELAMLPASEREQLLVKWNRTTAEYPREKFFDELFVEQANRTPNSVAVEFEGRRMTYWELDKSSSEVGRRLRGVGVGPEVLVGVCMERSPELVVGLLAIMKAGGAYVPLDPTYPKERLLHIIEDAQPRVVLSQKSIRDTLFKGHAGVLCIEELANIQTRDLPSSNERSSENLVYVLYTSGSTGKPKGVEILHQALMNLLVAMEQQLGLASDDALLALTTVSFDISALELFLPLMVGARVVLASRQTASDGFKLLELLDRSGATVIQATPATWRLLLEAGWSGHSQLKVVCGGEALARDLADALLERCGSLWNGYGPTETTIYSAVAKIQRDQPIVIGRPIANTSLYILDENRQPLPVGVPGELYIGGDGLARGYRNRPDLTAEKFVPHPFPSHSSARLYRTGDVARYLPDGNVDYMGRLDNQVKIRGFRIELGEIESVLTQFPEVRQAVAAIYAVGTGDNRLVAYVVPQRDTPALPIERLRAQLKLKLPEFMVPSAFVVLDELPLTPNGKVDRRALPVPETQPLRGYRAPRAPLEEIMCELYSNVLDVPKVGIDDSFFALGGHSLLAMQLVSRIRKTLGVELPVRAVFESPAVVDLVARIPDASTAQAALTPTVRPDRLPLSYTQERFWFLNRLEGDAGEYRIGEAFRLRGELDIVEAGRGHPGPGPPP